MLTWKITKKQIFRANITESQIVESCWPLESNPLIKGVNLLMVKKWFMHFSFKSYNEDSGRWSRQETKWQSPPPNSCYNIMLINRSLPSTNLFVLTCGPSFTFLLSLPKNWTLKIHTVEISIITRLSN